MTTRLAARTCPTCEETISADAQICPYCDQQFIGRRIAKAAARCCVVALFVGVAIMIWANARANHEACVKAQQLSGADSQSC
jgi:hypothetical protein